jgi:5-methylcytosine-specific restriction endonuclease McrA
MRKSAAKTIINHIDNFFGGSNTFRSITFCGCYDMPREHVLTALRHYLETGENVLDDYSELEYLSWSREEDDEYYSKEKRDKIRQILKNESFWNVDYFLSDEKKQIIKDRINRWSAHDKHINTYKAKRKRASQYTSKPHIRKKVFDRHGKKCLKCGSTKNIQIDHIVPVASGGENKIDNLQPLCKKCNSAKGAGCNNIFFGINNG